MPAINRYYPKIRVSKKIYKNAKNDPPLSSNNTSRNLVWRINYRYTEKCISTVLGHVPQKKSRRRSRHADNLLGQGRRAQPVGAGSLAQYLHRPVGATGVLSGFMESAAWRSSPPRGRERITHRTPTLRVVTSLSRQLLGKPAGRHPDGPSLPLAHGAPWAGGCGGSCGWVYSHGIAGAAAGVARVQRASGRGETVCVCVWELGTAMRTSVSTVWQSPLHHSHPVTSP